MGAEGAGRARESSESPRKEPRPNAGAEVGGWERFWGRKGELELGGSELEESELERVRAGTIRRGVIGPLRERESADVRTRGNAGGRNAMVGMVVVIL